MEDLSDCSAATLSSLISKFCHVTKDYEEGGAKRPKADKEDNLASLPKVNLIMVDAGPNELLIQMRDPDLGELLFPLKGDNSSLTLRFFMTEVYCFVLNGATVVLGFAFGFSRSFLNFGIFPLAKYF